MPSEKFTFNCGNASTPVALGFPDAMGDHMFLNRMPRYEVLSEDDLATLDGIVDRTRYGGAEPGMSSFFRR